MIKKVAKKIFRKIDPSDKGRIRRLMKSPPDIRPDEIVFVSSDDYTGNPKALFLYMIEHGYNERYKITWLFEKQKNLFEFDIPNVRSVLLWKKNGERTAAAQEAIMRARYIFFSHNVNWCRSYREGQTFIDLWHGCGYKNNIEGDKKVIKFDYVMVTGKAYIDVFKKVMKKPDAKVLDLGYPRNESFFTTKSNAPAMLAEMKKEAGADKAIMWLPTYRKSVFSRLDTDTGKEGETGLPLLYTMDDLRTFDCICRDKGVLVILKQHILAKDYGADVESFRNIRFLNDKILHQKDADLYEMLGVADALLTDYSSVATDYLLADRPMGFTMDDFEEYKAARGFCFDNVKDYMPGHHIFNMDDLAQFVTDVAEEKDPHAEWRARIMPEIHTYKDGFSKRILEYFGI